ncbi:MAG TPA: glycosyltransferase family 2 protein [Vicinamibacterales bacterium]|nr:glycosyltransferase family 2 protein [Vicinamibacterales bacterium]
MQLTVTVIAFNEAGHIAAALDSVAWADEIIVVDSNSTDGTADIARQKATRVIVRAWAGYSEQKNFAADQASHDWVLSVDADERVTPALAAEIRGLLEGGPAARGYRVRRVTRYLGRWIRTTDWFPDYQLRLYDRRAGRWNGMRIHESFRLNEGAPAQLHAELEHYAYRDVSHHLQKIDAYTTLIADQWMAEGRRTSPIRMALHPPLAFLRNYILRAGFREGGHGLLISMLNSYYVFLKFAKLWERQRRR